MMGCNATPSFKNASCPKRELTATSRQGPPVGRPGPARRRSAPIDLRICRSASWVSARARGRSHASRSIRSTRQKIPADICARSRRRARTGTARSETEISRRSDGRAAEPLGKFLGGPVRRHREATCESQAGGALAPLDRLADDLALHAAPRGRQRPGFVGRAHDDDAIHEVRIAQEQSATMPPYEAPTMACSGNPRRRTMAASASAWSWELKLGKAAVRPARNCRPDRRDNRCRARGTSVSMPLPGPPSPATIRRSPTRYYSVRRNPAEAATPAHRPDLRCRKRPRIRQHIAVMKVNG